MLQRRGSSVAHVNDRWNTGDVVEDMRDAARALTTANPFPAHEANCAAMLERIGKAIKSGDPEELDRVLRSRFEAIEV